MPKNNLQALYNRLERRFALAEETFLHAEKLRHELKANYEALLVMVKIALGETERYPQAQLRKRLGLIDTLLKNLALRQQTEERSFNALGFLFSRLRLRLASEMLEPRLYGKIRAALAEETQLAALRAKYPDAENVLTAPAKKTAPDKKIRLLLVAVRDLHYAIPIKKIVQKTEPGPTAEKLRANGHAVLVLAGGPTDKRLPLAIAFIDFAGKKKLVYCDTYFTPVELPQRLLRKKVIWVPPEDRFSADFRPQVQFYGRRFFVYGARLSYTVRPGERKRTVAG